jgi:dUTP pyrophosphatase
MIKDIVVNIKKIDPKAIIPSYSIEGDAAMDLTAISRTVDKYGNKVYGTGLAMEIPIGYVGLIFPRSSISKKTLYLANAVGVIDSGYRGEIICKFKPTIQFNTSPNPITFIQEELIYDDAYEVGDRVAQIMIIPKPNILFTEVNDLTDSKRGDNGFGSSGK